MANLTEQSWLPEKEALRRAVGWLAEQPVKNTETVEEASVRFDLSPVDEAFLLAHFINDDEQL